MLLDFWFNFNPSILLLCRTFRSVVIVNYASVKQQRVVKKNVNKLMANMAGCQPNFF